MIHSKNKELVLVIWVLGIIQPSSSIKFLMKWGCWGHWGQGGCWGCRGHWGLWGSKVWKITTEDFSVIQVLEFGFTLMFWKKNVLVESWKFMSNFSTLSIRGCWGQPILLFWKLVHKTQISKLPEPTRHHNSIRLWILLSLRADLLYILQYETPCTKVCWGISNDWMILSTLFQVQYSLHDWVHHSKLTYCLQVGEPKV